MNRVVITFIVAYAVFTVGALVAVSMGMSGGDAEGIFCILLVIAGVSGAIWLTLLNSRVNPVLYGLTHVPALGLLGFAFGNVSSGEEVQGLVSGIVVGVGMAAFATLTKISMAPAKRPPKIFVSYRRNDTPYVTGRIYDRLIEHYSADEVFMDIDGIAAGADFEAVLEDTLSRCNVVLAVIGDGWLSASTAGGNRRIDDPKDFVRRELESAIQRNRHIIPVLVRGTVMPSQTDLPESLSRFSFHNAITIRPDPDFNSDVNKLIQKIHVALSPQIVDASDSNTPLANTR